MLIPTLVLYGIAGVLVILTLRQGKNPWEGLRSGLELFQRLGVLLLAAFLLAGFLQVAAPEELVETWLGAEAGLKGILLGSVAGMLIPAGPYVVFPIVDSLYQAGAGIGTVVALVSGWSLWNLGRLPYELSLVGYRFTLARMATSAIFPPLAGVLAVLLQNLF